MIPFRIMKTWETQNVWPESVNFVDQPIDHQLVIYGRRSTTKYFSPPFLSHKITVVTGRHTALFKVNKNQRVTNLKTTL